MLEELREAAAEAARRLSELGPEARDIEIAERRLVK